MSNTQQPEALNLEEFRAKVTHAAREPLLARIAELEAARIAYASEFKPDADGEPDVGNIHANIRALKAQLSAIGAGGVEPLRKRVAPAELTAQEENQGDHLFDAVLHCPHSITHESVTLHFYPRQKEGHNALAQLRHRLAAYDLAAQAKKGEQAND